LHASSGDGEVDVEDPAHPDLGVDKSSSGSGPNDWGIKPGEDGARTDEAASSVGPGSSAAIGPGPTRAGLDAVCLVML
jgi:hypothetical protein